MRIAPLLLLALCLAVAPAMAQTIYSNGAPNGNNDAWTINLGYVVSDSFTVTGGATVAGVQFAAWLFAGDVLQTAEVSITSSEFGGTTYFDQVVNFTQQSNCPLNKLDYEICVETGLFTGPTLAGGTYWLNLQNASVPSGDPVYWDQNFGPSSASENTIGTIASEAFTVLGSTTGTTSTTTPEPSSIVLFATGFLGLAGVVRRKLS